MTNEEKQLLFKVLCEMLPYGVKIYAKTSKGDREGVLCTLSTKLMHSGNVTCIVGEMYDINEDEAHWLDIGLFKPYLRPMSSMTEEDMDKLNQYVGGDRFIFEEGVISVDENFYHDGFLYSDHEDYADIIDWLNVHHFDYRGLIPMGLALEAPEDMYK